MPALKLFGRKWLAASDDLVFPCMFEVLWRTIFLTFTAFATCRYWEFFESDVVVDNIANESVSVNLSQISCHAQDLIFIKTYFIGVNGIVALNLPVLLLMIYCSAQGSIIDIKARSKVPALLYLKIFLILPECAVNVMGTMWIFCDFINCINPSDSFSNTTIEVSVIFYWIVLSLIIFGCIIAYDPLGARKYRKTRDDNDNIDPTVHQEMMHKKVAKLWLRRFKFAFCCLSKDENGDEAFTQSAELFSHLFRGTDLTPSDIIAGSILLRIRQKKEHRELRRIQMLNDFCPRFSSDLSRVFTSQCPPWMNLRNAQHFLRFAVSSYGWPMVCAISPCRGFFGLIRKVTCCACMRNKSIDVDDDNCCNCNTAGTRYASRIKSNDVIYASFTNHVYEIPFCLLADHSTKSVVLTIRGSWSVSDIFTDLSAGPAAFTAPGMPEDTVAHYGMTICCEKIMKRLLDDNLLEKAMSLHPDYDLVITGHSLGAGLSILVGALLRPTYPTLKVYAFAAPNGMLSREAAKYTEQFTFNLVIGDDFVPRMNLESIENLKVGILETLQSCKLPKYRVVLNGFAYAVLGIPTRDLEKPWYDVVEISQQSNHSSTLLDQQIVATISHHAFGGNPTFQTPRRKLYVAGRILHISKKKIEGDKKLSPNTFEMRWASPEDFNEMKVMPRMFLDHFPQNIMKTLTTILNDRKNDSILSVDKI